MMIALLVGGVLFGVSFESLVDFHSALVCILGLLLV